MNPNAELDFHDHELELLSKLGFATNPFNKKVSKIEDAWNFLKDLEKKRGEIFYPIDGVVVKLNNNKNVETLGVVGKTPRAWCALKFPATEVVTTLLGVSWQVGRTGKVTPIAELEQVHLDGTIVKRASLHNYKQVLDLNLKIGDLVVIRKAGDIIPEIVRVV